METGDILFIFKALAERIRANSNVISDYEIRELIRDAVIHGIRATVKDALSGLSSSIEAIIQEEEEKMMQTLRAKMWAAFDQAIVNPKNRLED